MYLAGLVADGKVMGAALGLLALAISTFGRLVRRASRSEDGTPSDAGDCLGYRGLPRKLDEIEELAKPGEGANSINK